MLNKQSNLPRPSNTQAIATVRAAFQLAVLQMRPVGRQLSLKLEEPA